MENWIANKIRVRATRRIVACAMVFALVGVMAYVQQRYIRNFLFGPYAMEAAELSAIGDVSAAAKIFTRVTGSRVIDTGVQEYSIKERNGVETSRSVTAGFYALDMGDKFLICKSSSDQGTTATGQLAPLPGAFVAQFFDTPEMKSLRDRFYPYYLDTGSFRLPGYIALGGFAILAFIVLWIGRAAYRHRKDPSTHPVGQRVRSWGDPLEVAVAVQREAGTPRHKGRNGWRITEQYLIRSTFFSFELLRISDVLWAYKKITRHSVNFIPTGKTYEATVYCRDGKALIPGRQKKTDALLEFLAQQVPWAIFGYSKELEEIYKKDPEAVRQAVDQKRLEGKQTA